MRFVLAVFAAVLIVLAGCGKPGSAIGVSGDVIGTGKSADYSFTATTIDGTRFEGTTLKGKPTVLWFWAPWCPTCRAQIAGVSRLGEEYHGKVAVIGVGGLDSEAAIRDVAARIPHVTHLVDSEGVVRQHFGVTAQSTYTVIGADGEIKAEGYLDDDDLATLVARLAG